MNDVTTAVGNQIPFDYSGLEVSTAETLRSAASRIRERVKASIVGMIATGKDLIAAKNMLNHGAWGTWLQAEFGMTARTAERYMDAARRLADKSDIVSVLQPTTVYQLAAKSTPEATRVDIVERLEKGETLSAGDIAGQIAQAKHDKAEAERLAKTPPATLKRQRLNKEHQEKKRAAERLACEERQKKRRPLTAPSRSCGIAWQGKC
jgi:hypothetical protein